MKKTALTIGLFSLVVASTSFANPTTISKLANNVSSEIDPGAQATRDGRQKKDFTSNNFGQESQATRVIVKFD